MKSVCDTLREILEAFDRGQPRRALELIEAAYGEDIDFRDPLQHLRGKQAFMEMNRHFFDRGQQMRVSIERMLGDEHEGFATYTMRYTPRVGPTLTLPACTHCRARDGLIVYHRDYWDLLGSVMGSIPGVAAVYRAVVARLG